MSQFQCTACNGTYVTPSNDGTVYFHVCPPSVPAANARDENIPDTTAISTGKRKKEGLGITPSVKPIVTPT